MAKNSRRQQLKQRIDTGINTCYTLLKALHDIDQICNDSTHYVHAAMVVMTESTSLTLDTFRKLREKV